MNLRMLYFIFGLIAVVLFATLASGGLTAYRLEKEEVRAQSVAIHNTYLTDIVSQFRNELLSGSIRTFRIKLSELIGRGAFAEYAIYQKNTLIDSSPGFQSNEVKEKSLVIPIFFDDQKSNQWGEVVLVLNEEATSAFSAKITNAFGRSLMFLVLLGSVCFVAIAFFWHKLNAELDYVVGEIFGQAKTRSASRIVSALWQPALDSLRAHKKTHDRAAEKAAQVEQARLLMQVSRQVAHDIRAPLSALAVAVDSLGASKIEEAALVKKASARIHDIANDLLSRGRHGSNDFVGTNHDLSSADEVEVVDLGDLVSDIISEKTVLLKDTEIKIGLDAPENRVRSRVCRREASRLLSNLINNSIEALDSRTGSITIGLRSTRDRAQIIIQDDGIGIPENVLGRLGEAGLSFGKEHSNSGSGLGIFHAKTYIESVGGKFSVASKIGTGTIIDIQLPALTI